MRRLAYLSKDNVIKRWMFNEIFLWYRSGKISKEQLAKTILAKDGAKYHLISTGMLVLSFIAVTVCFWSIFGISYLMIREENSLLLLGIVGLLILELKARDNPHDFESGVQVGLLINSIAALCLWISMVGRFSDSNLYGIGLFLFICSVHYLSSVCAVGTFLLCLAKIFDLVSGLSLPSWFGAGLLSLVSLGAAVIAGRIGGRNRAIEWTKVLTALRFVALVFVYVPLNLIAYNAFVQGMNSNGAGSSYDDGANGAFVVATFLVPLVAFVWALKRADILVLRAAMLYFVGAAAAYKLYFSQMPLEVGLMLSGVFLVASFIFLDKFLRKPKGAWTSRFLLKSPVYNEGFNSFLISQTLSSNPPNPDSDYTGQGGSFGGGGSSGAF